jgi:CYTH domain-containing protein
METERRFLVVSDAWKALADGVRFRQGYLSVAKERSVRVRTIGHRGILTVKGLTRGISRPEFEYDIPEADATVMLEQLCEQPLLEKTRFTIRIGPLTWEVDEFNGVNRGLVVAEVELASAGQRFERPAWVGEDVSNDPRYFDANLVRHPYTTWATS